MESIHKDIEFLMKPNTKLGLEYIQKQKLEISGYEFDKIIQILIVCNLSIITY